MIRKDYDVGTKLQDAPLITFQLNHEHEWFKSSHNDKTKASSYISFTLSQSYMSLEDVKKLKVGDTLDHRDDV